MEVAIGNKNDKYLFVGFLEDKRLYNLTAAYWHRMVYRIAKERQLNFQPYINLYDSMGQKEYDANPIFSAFFPILNKAVRIIQDEPEAEAPDLTYWEDEIELKTGHQTKELVIAVALSVSSAEAAKRLIVDWLEV
jgi:hypothetical protein